MIEPPSPPDEAKRQRALCDLRLLDTPAEERFDRITRTAAALFDVPIALISLVDSGRQWFKSKVGLNAVQTSRDISFCGHAILGDAPLIVEDALTDVRFLDNPLVAGPPNIRFYAGMPLRSTDGWPLGTLCLIDSQPRNFSPENAKRLIDIAAWAEREINFVVEIDLAIMEMRNTFLRLVSHELRTPVTGMLGALEMMRSDIANGERVNILASIAEDGANRINRIVDDIVELAELDAGQRDLVPSRLELRPVIDAAVAPFADEAHSQNVELRVDFCGPNYADVAAKALQRILHSLIDNAICFAPQGSVVVLGTQILDGGWLRISVEDDGPGISAAHLPRLFMPFVQADSSDSRLHAGCGMGLAIARRLATAIGGRLVYESREGGGSRFSLELRSQIASEPLGDSE